MPIPVNNTGGNLAVIDQTAVAGVIMSLVGTDDDYASDFTGNQFVNAINQQQTSTVIVRLAATVTLADTPASRDGLLPRTGISANTVEVSLDADKYFKVGIDTLGVKPGQTSTEVGQAGGTAIVKAGNANLLAGLEAQGTSVEFDGTFGASTTADSVWGSMVGMITVFQEAEYTEDYVLYVRPSVWAKLITDVANLRSAADPRAAAAQLLGVSKVRVVNLPTALAVLSHRGAVAQAKVLSGIREDQEDFDRIVEGRIKVGTKVLDAGAALVLTDAAA